MKTIQMLKKNLALVVLTVLPILAMGLLVSCANKDDDGSGSGGGSVAVTGVTLDKTSEVIYMGGSTTLTATVLPSDATNKVVTWSSSDDTVATVDTNGKVTAVKVGTATITVTTDDEGKTATAEIMVLLNDEVLATPTPLPSGGIKFPMKTDDSGTGTINHKFAMAKTEVTYKLWKKVYDWANKDGGACDSATGQYCYTFANEGWKGGKSGGANSAGTVEQPVTGVSWRDVVVWCNAYTEWYNAVKSGSLSVVYKKSGTPLRDATNGADVDGLGNTFDPTSNTATGFRLPTSVEWEYAARLRKDATNTVADGKPTSTTKYPMKIGGTNYWFTKGNSASGATADYNDSDATGKVAWYSSNSGSNSHNVKEKTPNALGIYDMSGNVWEWCFDISSGSIRVYRGGGLGHGAVTLRVGGVSGNSPNAAGDDLGFRVARTVP